MHLLADGMRPRCGIAGGPGVFLTVELDRVTCKRCRYQGRVSLIRRVTSVR